MRAPKGLGPTGRALWRLIHQQLAEAGDEHELDERGQAILALACRQRDELAALEAALDDAGVIGVGSKGQPIVSGLIGEARQQRQAIQKLLGALALPDADAKPATMSQLRGRHAANARWHRNDPRPAASTGGRGPRRIVVVGDSGAESDVA